MGDGGDAVGASSNNNNAGVKSGTAQQRGRAKSEVVQCSAARCDGWCDVTYLGDGGMLESAGDQLSTAQMDWTRCGLADMRGWLFSDGIHWLDVQAGPERKKPKLRLCAPSVGCYTWKS